jgi:hypothetical protein
LAHIYLLDVSYTFTYFLGLFEGNQNAQSYGQPGLCEFV